uniref:Adrenomedullin n=1 Tax=Sinocyclocheilus anshuiensis TaxID=1608454 RepID=A0A671R965_9TELE
MFIYNTFKFIINCVQFTSLGHTIMEVAVLLLLTIPMSTTTPVRQTRRCLISNMNYTHGFTFVLSLCRRRAAQRGCQFGTCQVHNLASKLYRMGQSNGKDESKKANDPTGYGR